MLVVARALRFTGVMSTVDPSIAKQQRAARRPSNLRVVITLIVLLGGGFLTGYGWGGFGSMIDVDTEQLVAPATLVAIPVGMTTTVIGFIAWSSLVLKRSDIGLMFGNATALLGGGIGVLVVSDGLEDAGVAPVVGVVLLVLAAAALLLGLVAAASRRRDRLRADDARRSGQETTATVTDRGWTVFHESARIFTTVTFSFVDLAGTRRWVQRAMVVRAEQPVENGQTTRLWFDAANPGDDRRIVVELAEDNPLRPTR